MIAPTRISVKVVPGASKDEIVGKLGEEWKIRVSAPPEGGKANKKICGLLADALGVPPNAVAVFSGHSSPRKVIEISVPCDLSLLASLQKN